MNSYHIELDELEEDLRAEIDALRSQVLKHEESLHNFRESMRAIIEACTLLNQEQAKHGLAIVNLVWNKPTEALAALRSGNAT